ncbi:hypothetical protein CMI38_03120 [Candidatus Pacearchaeota archaeon]|jgi:hypothetical protein|nr:hypothetical protein [Candidatus Pacearchaeota archaeon]|tara:strand:+ start:10124 stop:10402 length:279 start_codon:yes stop_codon:yes gene_type:complete
MVKLHGIDLRDKTKEMIYPGLYETPEGWKNIYLENGLLYYGYFDKKRLITHNGGRETVRAGSLSRVIVDSPLLNTNAENMLRSWAYIFGRNR